MRANEIKRVVCYFRYSSKVDRQVENSELRQRMLMEQYCISNQWEVTWIGGDEDVKGTRYKPKLMELKRLIEEKQVLADAVVVSKWDRLTRRNIVNFSKDVEWLPNNGLKLVISMENRIFDLKSDEDGLHISYRVAEASSYVKNLSENVRSGMIAKYKRGELKYGRLPFGYTKNEDGQVVSNDDLKLVPLIFDCALKNGVISAVPILRNSKRYQLTGKVPSNGTIRSILRNPIYVGKRTFGIAGVGEHGTINGKKTKTTRNVNRLQECPLPILDVKDKFPPVVSWEVFSDVQKMLDTNQQRLPKRRNAKYLFSGKLRCSCGAKLIAEKKVTHVNYVCPKSKNKKAGCEADFIGRKCVSEETVDFFINSFVRDTLASEKFHLGVFDKAVRFLKKRLVKGGNEKVEVLETIEELKKKKTKVFESFQDAGSDFDDIQRLVGVLNEKIAKLEASLEKDDVSILDLVDVAIPGTLGSNQRYVADIVQVAADFVRGRITRAGAESFFKDKGQRIVANWPTNTAARRNKVIVEQNRALFFEMFEEVEIVWEPTPQEVLDSGSYNNKSRPKRWNMRWKYPELENRRVNSSKDILIVAYPSSPKRPQKTFVFIQTPEQAQNQP